MVIFLKVYNIESWLNFFLESYTHRKHKCYNILTIKKHKLMIKNTTKLLKPKLG
jgi:hypothetical protein